MRTRLFSKTVSAAILGAVLLSAVPAFAGSLKETVQAQLDASPFLAQQELKFRVLQEIRGNLTLELTQGPKLLRDLLRKGIELDGAGMREAPLKEDELKSLRCIRKAMKAVTEIQGVTDVSLTGALNPLDPAENDYNQAVQQMAQGSSSEREEAFQLLKHSAEAGYAPAQTDLAGYYILGGGVDPDDRLAAYWYRQAANQGEPKAIFNLARLLADGRGTPRDDVEAISWYRKAAAQDRVSAAKIKSMTSLALLLSTCPRAALRDGDAAMELLDQAQALEPQNPSLYEARAAALAQCGKFPEAVEQQKKWIEALDGNPSIVLSEKERRLAKARQRLELYQAHQIDLLPDNPSSE